MYAVQLKRNHSPLSLYPILFATYSSILFSSLLLTGFVCDSTSNRNCYNGNALTILDSQSCGPGTAYCMKRTVLGVVRRSCASQCTEGTVNGVATRCCTSAMCNGPSLDDTFGNQPQYVGNGVAA